MENKSKPKIQNDKIASSLELLDQRIVYLNDEIQEDSSKEIIEQLLKLDACNNKDITMYINSGGGAVNYGLAIYDVMNMIKSDVRTIGIGRCASMAAILLINGAKGKRYILPNAEIMIHEVSSETYGKITAMQNKLNHSKVLNERLRKIIAQKTKKTLKQIKVDTLNKDTWFNSTEALEWGFVDKIIN